MVLVHASHGMVLAVWIASAAFAAVDESLEQAARNLGVGPWRCFTTVMLLVERFLKANVLAMVGR